MKKRLHTIRQVILCTIIISVISALCFAFRDYISYRIVAIILLFTVGTFAITLDIVPVIITATLSSLILNFFFIPPIYTFHINQLDDLLLFLIFFVIAIVNAVLTYRIRKANQAANDRKEKEKTIKLYNTLFNSLSHELRTPLATIIASADTLQENCNNLSAVHREALLHQITSAGNQLNKQVDNLLSMSRLESGTLQLKAGWCDINDLIFEQIGRATQTTTHNIVFTPDQQMPLISADVGLLEQVIGNILHNALLYTPAGSTITISLAIEKDQYLVVVISDNGPGVPGEALPHLFDKFYRVRGTNVGGNGLGLSICKGYTEVMGGSITVGHNQPTGLQFTITIPVATSYINKLKHE